MDELKSDVTHEDTVTQQENEAIDRLMVARRAIQARSAADTQMVTELLNNQTVELLQNQQYIYDFEDSQAKVQTPIHHIYYVHILSWNMSAAHHQRFRLRPGSLGQGSEEVG